MGSLTEYSGLTTKIQAMRSRLMTPAQFREFVELPGIPAGIAYLRNQSGYAEFFQSADENQLHRVQIELMLKHSLYRDFSKIYRFANAKQKEFLKLYFMRFEIFYLKMSMNNVFDVRGQELDFSIYDDFLDKFSDLDYNALSSAADPREFLERLKGSIYYEPLSVLEQAENASLFDFETCVDLFYFGTAWKKKDKIVGKEDAAYLTEILGAKFDLLNLQWIWRCRKYFHMSAPEIYALLIPVNYHIHRDTMKQMVETEDMNTLAGLMEHSYYFEHCKDLPDTTFGGRYSYIMKKILSAESRKHPYSIATVYSYLYHKEHEVNQLTIALECLRYKIPADQALKRLACQ